MTTINKVRLGIWLGVGTLITVLGICDAYYEYRLVHSGVSTMAVVTEKRFTSRSPLPGIYSVRYRYESAGTSYTFGDFLGRTNLWASVSQNEYKDIARLPIQYLSDRPNLSRPSGAAFSYLDHGGLALLGALMLVVGVVGLRRASTRARDYLVLLSLA